MLFTQTDSVTSDTLQGEVCMVSIAPDLEWNTTLDSSTVTGKNFTEGSNNDRN